MRTIKLLVILSVVSLCFGVGTPRAIWFDDGVSVCTYSNSQSNAKIIPDDAGGAIIVWEDMRGGTYKDIYAQRIDALGNVKWTSNGVAICTATGDQRGVRIAPDGSGGAVIAWTDERAGLNFPSVYAQRIDGSGNALWTTDGVAVCPTILSADSVEVASDGAGGAIVVWQDLRHTTDLDIYAQRIDSLGSTVWTSDGEPISTASNDQLAPRITEDGSGGAIVTWEDNRSGFSTAIYAQRIDASGNKLWTLDGEAVCSAVWNSIRPEIVSDGAGGAYIVWNIDYSGDFDIYAQKISSAGIMEWVPCGLAVSAASGHQAWQLVIEDGFGGMIIVWSDLRAGNWDVYAQRINSLGTTLWTANGEAVCTTSDLQVDPHIASDGSGGAIIAWRDARGGDLDIYAQRMDASGSPTWTIDGVAVCSDPSGQNSLAITDDGFGGAIAAWWDDRNNNNDIFAQYVDSLGRAGYEPPEITAVQDVPNDQGGKLILQWGKSTLDTQPAMEIDYYAAWRRLPLYAAASAQEKRGPEFVRVPLDYKGEAFRTFGGYSWEWLGNVPAHAFDSYSLLVTSLSDSMGNSSNRQYFMVTAYTGYPSIYYDSAVDSGYSVDNLSPASPAPVAGDQKVSPPGLDIHWPASPAADFSHYAVYRGTDEFFVPGDGNRVAAPVDTSYFDASWTWNSGYYYKVSTIDVHGNESAFALLRPDGVTGTGDHSPPRGDFLARNVPNPFNPSTSLRFGLSKPGTVSLRIYDANGRLVRVLEDGWKRAGEHSARWDGRDGAGNILGSGVYFAVMKSGDFRAVTKMVLMK